MGLGGKDVVMVSDKAKASDMIKFIEIYLLIYDLFIDLFIV
jgi:hypothetical protein